MAGTSCKALTNSCWVMEMLSFRPLEAEDIECRVSTITDTAVKLLLYKDARVDMRLLDETVGPENWQCGYDTINGKLFCNVGLRFKDGEWVWKQDVGIPSNMESTKGEASDAFKRACFKWGIGRELYTAPEIWVDRKLCKKLKNGKNGKIQCYDDFRVTEIAVNDGRIDALVICNMSNKGAVVFGRKQESSYDSMKREVWAWCKRHDCATEESFRAKLEGIKKRPNYTETPEFFAEVAEEFRNG